MFSLLGACGHDEDPKPSYKWSGFRNHEEAWAGAGHTRAFHYAHGVSAALQPPARPRGPHRGNCRRHPCWVGCWPRGLAGMQELWLSVRPLPVQDMPVGE